MKIRFYRIDYVNGKGELRGTLEVLGGKSSLETHDSILQEFLTKPYTTIGGHGSVGGASSDSLVTYKPYSREYIDAVETECWTRGYVAEREN